MAFSFGLGADTMLNQFQRDATQFKLLDIAGNIQKLDVQVGQAGAYVDYTFSHLNRFMQRDQENDDHATFLSEYQALLRSRMQQMITDLTAALTRDLDKAMNTVRAAWDDAAAGGRRRTSAQGYTSEVEDAGAARMMYNFMTGFANAATPSNGSLNNAGSPYTGVPTYDVNTGATINKVSIDTQADASFSGVNAVTNATQGYVRGIGTATLQQSFPEDTLTEAVIDNLRIRHNSNNVLYNKIGGGFNVGKNDYKFLNPDAARFDSQNVFFLNTTIANGATETGNLNDNAWDTSATFGSLPGQTNPYQQFDQINNAKNEFQRILYDTIFELDQRRMLRDIMRLSEKDGLLNDIQIASTTSINTGSQIAASIKLNFIPNQTGPVASSNATSVTVSSNASNFAVGDVVYLTTQATPKLTIARTITGIAGNVLTFASPPNPAAGLPPIIANSTVDTTREDLGGRIQVIMDRCNAFFHS